MAVVDDAGLKKQMAAGELSGLFVVAGEEKYMVKRLARQLIQRAAGDAFPEFNDQSFTNESSLDSIGDAAQALPFFASASAFPWRISMWNPSLPRSWKSSTSCGSFPRKALPWCSGTPPWILTRSARPSGKSF